MNLQDFIKETLVQIVNGIEDAQLELKETNAIISPKIHNPDPVKEVKGMLLVRDQNPATVVSFDVALTSTEGTGTKGGIGVVAGMVNLGSSGESKQERVNVSRVSVNIPVSLPHGKNS